jgi:fructose PTS system EIIBC or EIIC component
MKFVAVTSCPTGIAHTFMAAESLEQAAQAGGHEIQVETQGATNSEPLSPQVIAEADAVIFAADVEVRDAERFAGKPLVRVPVKRAINDGGGLIAEAERAASERAAAPAGAGAPARPAPPPAAAAAGAGEPGFGSKLRGWLMTGVSYMIPFVAAGGILIALAFMFGGPEVKFKVEGGSYEGVQYEAITDFTNLLQQAGWPGVLYQIGVMAFGFLLPVLAGFIAFGMAGRPGLVPGFVAGAISGLISAGFLGALVGGLIAGALAMWIARIKVPRAVAGVMPVVIIPLLATLIVGVLMLIVIGEPIAAVQRALTNWLNGLSGANAIVLGLLLGLMMAFDMGGPVNKTAYTFALAGLASDPPNLEIMAAVMAAGMTPPLALALATVVRKHLFSDAERKAGEAAWLLGASFVTEGAIPFAAADPLRVIPSLMVGSATTGALSMAFGAQSRAPHGGIWVLPVIGNPLMWLVAIVIGTLVSAALVVVLKSMGKSDEEIEAEIGAKAAVTR